MAINDSGAGQTDVDDVDKNDVLISVSFIKRCDLTLKLKKNILKTLHLSTLMKTIFHTNSKA